MKRWIIAALCTLALTACGSEDSTSKLTSASQEEKSVPVEENGVIVYRNAKWQSDFHGLKISIEGVIATNDVNKALEIESEEPGNRAIIVGITTDNTTDKEFYSYLSSTKLVTSNREQASPDLFLSNDFPLEIAANAKTEGVLVFNLKSEEDIKNITSITLDFEITNKEPYEAKQFKIELPLK
jgi:hypothetical protein